MRHVKEWKKKMKKIGWCLKYFSTTAYPTLDFQPYLPADEERKAHNLCTMYFLNVILKVGPKNFHCVGKREISKATFTSKGTTFYSCTQNGRSADKYFGWKTFKTKEIRMSEISWKTIFSQKEKKSNSELLNCNFHIQLLCKEYKYSPQVTKNHRAREIFYMLSYLRKCPL